MSTGFDFENDEICNVSIAKIALNKETDGLWKNASEPVKKPAFMQIGLYANKASKLYDAVSTSKKGDK